MKIGAAPRRAGSVPATAPSRARPPGVASVLSVLSSPAVVLDSEDRVLQPAPPPGPSAWSDGDQLVVEELLALARQVRRDGEIREGEVEVSTSGVNGRTTSFAVRVAPLDAAVGDGGLVLLLVEDQTESRRVEEVRRDFVANTSHELKTPVGALALLAETVEDAADDPEAVRRFAGRMRQEASRLTNLVQDMITLSRIQAAEPVPDPIAGRAGRRGRRGPGPVPDEGQPPAASSSLHRRARLSVMGDEDLLVTALRNLLENAVAYSPDKTRVVCLTRRVSDDAVEISVTDQGIGIPERDLERIFERFYRVDPARSRATGGTGLGLAIVKHVTAAHGGKVTVLEQGGRRFDLHPAGCRYAQMQPDVGGGTVPAIARSARRQ